VAVALRLGLGLCAAHTCRCGSQADWASTLSFIKWHPVESQGTTPVGPLLFCNTIQPLLTSLDSDMNLDYLDDVSPGGPADVVAADVVQIAKVGGDMGLHLNASKCELIADPNFSTTDVLLQSFTRVDVCDASLLGAPLFHGSELDKSWNGCCGNWARAAEVA